MIYFFFAMWLFSGAAIANNFAGVSKTFSHAFARYSCEDVTIHKKNEGKKTLIDAGGFGKSIEFFAGKMFLIDEKFFIAPEAFVYWSGINFFPYRTKSPSDCVDALNVSMKHKMGYGIVGKIGFFVDKKVSFYGIGGLRVSYWDQKVNISENAMRDFLSKTTGTVRLNGATNGKIKITSPLFGFGATFWPSESVFLKAEYVMNIMPAQTIKHDVDVNATGVRYKTHVVHKIAMQENELKMGIGFKF